MSECTTCVDSNGNSCGTGNTYTPTHSDPTVYVPPAGPTVAEVIEKLAGVIEFSHLAQSLRGRIELITTLESGFTQFFNQTVSDNAVISQELTALRDDLTAAVGYINNQVNIEVNERTALVNSVNQVVASLNSGLSAAIEEESTVRAEQTGALFAEKTVKVDLAGHVSGYGLSAYADPSGAVSEFRIAADRFSIAPPAVVGTVAPSGTALHDGKVWVDTTGGGAVTKWWNATSGAWQLTPVQAAQPFVYLSTPATLPDGTVVPAGLYVNSASITKLTADKIDTRGLNIKDNAGNIIFSSGNNLDYSRVGGAKPPSNADNTASNTAAGIWGQGSFATTDRITSSNSSTLIADLAVGRLKLARVGVNYQTVSLTNGIGHVLINHGYGQNPIAVTLAWVSPANTDAYPCKTLILNLISSSQIGVTMSMFTPAGAAPANGTTVQCFWVVI